MKKNCHWKCCPGPSNIPKQTKPHQNPTPFNKLPLAIPVSLLTAFFDQPLGSLSTTACDIFLLVSLAFEGFCTWLVTSTSIEPADSFCPFSELTSRPNPSKRGLDSGTTCRLNSRISPRLGNKGCCWLRSEPLGKRLWKTWGRRNLKQIKKRH